MCTITCAWGVFDDVPILLGANREERWGRPAAAPSRISESPVVFAPIDLEARGTWLGINEYGLVVAVTNRPKGPQGSRSRGLLVRDLLSKRSVERAQDHLLDDLDAHSYAGCNMLVASPDAATVVEWDGEQRMHRLDPGLHVLVNRGMQHESAKAAIVRSRLLRSTTESPRTFLDRLPTVLSEHGIGTCLHRDTRGTRSSSIITVDTNETVTWKWADGPPCQTDYVSVLEGEL